MNFITGTHLSIVWFHMAIFTGRSVADQVKLYTGQTESMNRSKRPAKTKKNLIMTGERNVDFIGHC